MKWTWDIVKRHYIDEKGTPVPLSDVIKVVDQLTRLAKKDMKRVALRLTAKEISLTEFEIQMATMIRQGELAVSMIARGGKNVMTPKTWGTSGQNIKTQYQYLNRFERAIKNGQLSDAQIIHRAQLYASSFRTDYMIQMHDEQKQVDGQRKGRRLLNAAESCSGCIGEADREWIPIEDMAEIGSFECMNFCLCELEYE